MVELSKEKIEKMLHDVSLKKEESNMILRSIYIRYMKLFEKYFADIDALDDDTIAQLRSYHEETVSLIKYYYMDIPQDICKCLTVFNDEYSSNLLGPDWKEYLSENFKNFRENNPPAEGSKKSPKEAFEKQTLDSFYDTMDYIFREGFGTRSQSVNSAIKGIAGLLFGGEK